MSAPADGDRLENDAAMEAEASDVALAVAKTDGDAEGTAVVEKTRSWMQLTEKLEDDIRLESENYRKANER